MSVTSELLTGSNLQNLSNLHQSSLTTVPSPNGFGSSIDDQLNAPLWQGSPSSALSSISDTTQLSATSPTVSSPSNLLSPEIDLGTLGNAAVNLKGSVGDTDTVNVYRFNLNTAGSLSLSLLDLRADADFRLIQDVNDNGVVDPGEEIERSENRGSRNETIGIPSLAAGTYFVQVYQYSGDTNYTLRLSATPDSRPVPLATQTATLATQAVTRSSVDGAGNNLATARNIGVVSSKQTFNDFVGSTDPYDYYRFTTKATGTVNISLTGLSADADLQLISSAGTSIQVSNNNGTVAESIVRTLSAGDYYVRVYRYSGDTNYTLSLSSTAQTLPSGYSSNFGYGEVDAAAAVAKALGQNPFPAVPDLGGNQWDLDQIKAPEVWAKAIPDRALQLPW